MGNKKFAPVLAGITIGVLAYYLGLELEEAKSIIEVAVWLTAIRSNLKEEKHK